MSNIKCAVETKLSDEKCLVVQFINERHKPVQVGFQAWLKEENTKSDLSHLLNSEVIIRWPVGEDIKCARMMEKIIKKKNIIWEDLVIRVRSVGIFTDMCQHVKNIELFGVPNPSREERHKLCYRPSGSSDQNHMLDFDSSEDDSEPDESSKKRKNESLNVEKTQALLQSQIKQKKQKIIETSSNGKTHSLLQSQIENLSRDFVKKASQIDLINDEEENDEDSSMFKWTKAKLTDLINTLKIENKKLREDNARLRTLRAINEDLYKMSDMSSTLVKNMDKLRRKIDSLQFKADQSNKDKNSDNNNNNNNNKPSYLNENEQKRNNNSNNIGSTLEIVETLSENSQQQILLNIAHIEQPEQFQDKPTITIEDFTDFAGRQVQTDKLKRLSRSKLSLFTASVMDLVFTDEEMANSSMTGIISNFSRGQNKLHAEEVKAKPELNLPVKNAVIEYILKEFDCPTEGPLNKAAIAEIFKAMKSKLNNKSNICRNKNKHQ